MDILKCWAAMDVRKEGRKRRKVPLREQGQWVLAVWLVEQTPTTWEASLQQQVQLQKREKQKKKMQNSQLQSSDELDEMGGMLAIVWVLYGGAISKGISVRDAKLDDISAPSLHTEQHWHCGLQSRVACGHKAHKDGPLLCALPLKRLLQSEWHLSDVCVCCVLFSCVCLAITKLLFLNVWVQLQPSNSGGMKKKGRTMIMRQQGMGRAPFFFLLLLLSACARLADQFDLTPSTPESH